MMMEMEPSVLPYQADVEKTNNKKTQTLPSQARKKKKATEIQAGKKLINNHFQCLACIQCSRPSTFSAVLIFLIVLNNDHYRIRWFPAPRAMRVRSFISKAAFVFCPVVIQL